MNFVSPRSAPACKLCGGRTGLRHRLCNASGAFDLLECARCGFHFIDILDADEIECPDYDLEAFAKSVEAGLESNKRRIEHNLLLLNRFARGGSLLDVGCGAGAFLARAAPGFRSPMGIEVDPRYLALSRSRGLSVSDRRLEDACWDHAAGQFDAITMWDVIEHVNDPAAIAARAHRLLKPGGVLLIDTPNRDGLLYRFGDLTARLTGGRHATTMGIQYSIEPFCHKQIFRKVDISRLLSSFTRVQIWERFELSFPVDFYLKEMTGRRIPPPIAALANLAIAILPIRNKLIIAAAK